VPTRIAFPGIHSLCHPDMKLIGISHLSTAERCSKQRCPSTVRRPPRRAFQETYKVYRVLLIQLATCHLQLFQRSRFWPEARQLLEVRKERHPVEPALKSPCSGSSRDASARDLAQRAAVHQKFRCTLKSGEPAKRWKSVLRQPSKNKYPFTAKTIRSRKSTVETFASLTRKRERK